MKIKEAEKLKPGEEIIHNRYGVSRVKEVTFCRGDLFGVVIHVETEEGRKLLSQDCGCLISDLMVDNPRSLKERGTI